MKQTWCVHASRENEGVCADAAPAGIGLRSDEDHVAKMISFVDADGNGTIEFDEFVVMMTPMILDQSSSATVCTPRDPSRCARLPPRA